MQKIEEIDLENLAIESDSETDSGSSYDPSTEESDSDSYYESVFCLMCDKKLVNEDNEYYNEELDCFYCEKCYNEQLDH